MTDEGMRCWAIVVAAGSGRRFGSVKQFQLVAGRPMVQWSLDVLAPLCAGIVVVVPRDATMSVLEEWKPDLASEYPLHTVGGGATRAASVRAGLAAIPPMATHVLVHDAARPVLTAELVRRVQNALAGGADAAIPTVPVTDTLRRTEGGAVDRSQFVAVQTPQGFKTHVLLRAHEQGGEATDDASLVDKMGLDVAHVDGDATNLKVTVASDLVLAEILLQ